MVDKVYRLEGRECSGCIHSHEHSSINNVYYYISSANSTLLTY